MTKVLYKLKDRKDYELITMGNNSIGMCNAPKIPYNFYNKNYYIFWV